jgi:hypothetical protein
LKQLAQQMRAQKAGSAGNKNGWLHGIERMRMKKQGGKNETTS